MGIGGTILTEATLSFLGLGVKFPFASWGNIINDVNNIHVLKTYWFIWIPAGVLLLTTVLAFNIVGAYSKGERGPDIDNIAFRDIRVEANELLRIHHMRSKSCSIHDITLDCVSGAAPNVSHIWAKAAAPFQNIVFKKVDVPAEYERINASVVVEGGSFKERKLSQEEMDERRGWIEEEKKLLY